MEITEKLDLQKECISNNFLFREKLSPSKQIYYCKASVYFPHIEKCNRFCKWQEEKLSRVGGDGSNFYRCKNVPEKDNSQTE